MKITPIATATTGPRSGRSPTTAWTRTRIHLHLYDVQLLNRVTWDNIVSPPDPTELGWKDTVRVSPLEDTIVALRPIIPQLPFELPNSIRPLNPMTADRVADGLQQHRRQRQPDDADRQPARQLRLGVRVALPHPEPRGDGHDAAAGGGAAAERAECHRPHEAGQHGDGDLYDNSITETSFQLQRTADGTTWTNVSTPLASPLDVPNTKGASLALSDSGVNGNPGPVYGYRVAAVNTVGYGGAFPSVSAQSVSNTVLSGTATAPAAPTDLNAALVAGPGST